VNISETRLQVIHKTLRDVEVQQMDSNVCICVNLDDERIGRIE
jgi:hypothetical protein